MIDWYEALVFTLQIQIDYMCFRSQYIFDFVYICSSVHL